MLLLTGALMLGACAVGERPMLVDEGLGDVPADAANGNPLAGTSILSGSAVPGGGAAPDGAGASAISDPIAATTDTIPVDQLGSGPQAIITPTGVLVPVLALEPGGAFVVETPCGNQDVVQWGQPLRSVEVMLDPGHGGDERGAIGPSGETEAELNLDIARRAAALLDAEGVDVALTRTGDYRVPISVRAALADRLGAQVLVSIHHNSPTPTPGPDNGPGTEVYIQGGSAESQRLGGLMHAEIVAALSVFDADWAARTDAGVLTVVNDEGEDAYGINRYPLTTSVLAELAYLSNPTEALVLATDEYRQGAAQAVANAIIRHLAGDAGGTAPVPEPRLATPAGGTGGSEGCIDPPLE